MPRVNALIFIFLCLFVVLSNSIIDINNFDLLFSAISIFAIYGFAVCLNDIADVKIDSVNLTGARDRPLANKDLSLHEIVVLLIFYLTVALVFSGLVGLNILIIVLISAAASVAYSYRPFLISHKPIQSLLLLAFCYSAVPSLLAIQLVNVELNVETGALILSLFLICTSRLLLKDFRDRKGDLKYKKETFLLKYGKKKTIETSNILLLAGLSLFVLSNVENFILIIALVPLILATFYSRNKFFLSSNYLDELRYISRDVLFVNGILLMSIGYLLIQSYYDSSFFEIIFCFTVIAMYLYSPKSIGTSS